MVSLKMNLDSDDKSDVKSLTSDSLKKPVFVALVIPTNSERDERAWATTENWSGLSEIDRAVDPQPRQKWSPE
jgi:hypothetical protein